MLTNDEKKIHQQALALSKARKRNDAEVVANLILVESTKFYRKLDKSSLFGYATKTLGHDESFAYAAIAVSRKALEFPALMTAIEEQKLSVSKASRMVSSLNQDNADELVLFACTHTTDEINEEAARRNPKSAGRDKVKWLSKDVVQITTTMSRKAYEKLVRAESLQAPKKRGEVIEICVDAFLHKKDPVKKAERAQKQKSLCFTDTDPTPHGRVPLTARQKHEVFLRDGGACTHIGLDGIRCNSERFIDVHHIILVSAGGTNKPSNLTLLCSFHHDLVHQLSFGIDGQSNWIRSPSREYQPFS